MQVLLAPAMLSTTARIRLGHHGFHGRATNIVVRIIRITLRVGKTIIAPSEQKTKRLASPRLANRLVVVVGITQFLFRLLLCAHGPFHHS
mmetsp:Transcript_25156/g.79396  ORF Transcript_25156/g.79396 Transcript_25156/m.79396 type:complete len:90 (-) Transcript_25156:121-390(-)